MGFHEMVWKEITEIVGGGRDKDDQLLAACRLS